jgi:hypothetical protein
VNATHVETHTLEDDIAAFRDQLLKREPSMDRAELQRQIGNYTARRKVELGLFHHLDT